MALGRGLNIWNLEGVKAGNSGELNLFELVDFRIAWEVKLTAPQGSRNIHDSKTIRLLKRKTLEE